MNNNLKFETLQLHAGQTVDSDTKSRAVPIYQTSAYMFDSVEHAGDLFALKQGGNIYTRIMNPTTDVFETRMAALENGVGALATASGTAAIMYAVMNIAMAGDEIVSARSLYGGTHTLFAHILPNYGITFKMVDSDEIDEFRAAITEKTKAIFIEAIGNPTINLVDIEAVAKVAHEHRIPLLIDSTFATPYLLQPFDFGADVSIHSATKFINGHGTSIGGVIVDSGRFDWEASGKFPSLTTPDESYHGVVYTRDFGAAAYITKARTQLLRNTGACISPFNSFLMLQGLETLSLRVERHVENTQKIIEYLLGHEQVSWVNYPSIETNKYNALAKKYYPKGAGSIFTFGAKGGYDAAVRFIDSLQIFSHLANVADAKSLVIHPASTTHQQMNTEEQLAAGITPDMIRVSVGIENVDDLIQDLDQALR